MRVLLDESVRRDFAAELTGHTVDHVEDVGLKSARNGKLLEVARANYEALVTLDRGILFEHNHGGQSLIIAVLRVQDSTIESLRLATRLIGFSGSCGAWHLQRIIWTREVAQWSREFLSRRSRTCALRRTTLAKSARL